MRKASIDRKTTETAISVSLDLDGTGAFDVKSGVGFLDHMLEQLSRHSLIDITLRAQGDTHIDFHHTTEDAAIALGQAMAKALGDPGFFLFDLIRNHRPDGHANERQAKHPAQNIRADGGGDPGTQSTSETMVHDGRCQNAEDDRDGFLETCGEDEGEKLGLVADFSEGDDSG